MGDSLLVGASESSAKSTSGAFRTCLYHKRFDGQCQGKIRLFAGIFVKKVKPLMVVYNALMETMEKKTTAEKVREIRKERGLYQHELAARAKLSVQTVRNVEAGRHEPELPTLRKIAKALGVPLADLLG